MKLFLLVLVIALGGGFLIVRDRAADRPVTEAASMPAASDTARHADVAIDQRRQQLIGVRTARVTRGTLARTIRAAGTVRYDETRLTDVNLKLDGWIIDLYVNYVGQPVARGQALFTLFSTELLATQNELLLGLRNRDQLTDSQAANAGEFGERVVDVPRQTLLRWDVPADQVRAVEETRRLLSAVEFRLPADGVVIEKTAVKGMHAERGQTLYKLADLSVVWVEADFHETDISLLRLGATAAVTVGAWPGRRFMGRIVLIYPSLTEQTRTVRARIELTNRDGLLKPGMYADVEATVTPAEGLLVPSDAVVDSGTQQIVFVAQGEGYFEPRNVTIGARADGRQLILTGLHENEEVVARATFFLDSESQIRAGLQNYEAAPTPAVRASEGGHFDVDVQVIPNPPRTGKNVVEVHLLDPEGQVVTDADVQVLFSMAAMPSMNMPPMRSEAHLTHVDRGVYRGSTTILMQGHWDLTVTALRQGRPIATKQTTLIAR